MGTKSGRDEVYASRYDSLAREWERALAVVNSTGQSEEAHIQALLTMEVYREEMLALRDEWQSGEKTVMQVQYSACVTLSENTQVDIYTMKHEGRWEWFGSEKEVTGRDDLGCRVFRLLRNVDCGDARYDSSAAAIVAAVARYGDVPEDWGLAAVEDVIIDGDALFSGETTATCQPDWTGADRIEAKLWQQGLYGAYTPTK